jgi:hypothetical protein
MHQRTFRALATGAANRAIVRPTAVPRLLASRGCRLAKHRHLRVHNNRHSNDNGRRLAQEPDLSNSSSHSGSKDRNNNNSFSLGGSVLKHSGHSNNRSVRRRNSGLQDVQALLHSRRDREVTAVLDVDSQGIVPVIAECC